MNQVRFRFYEELNDYLPPGNRKVWFDFFFIGPVSIKEALQSMKVPEREIDLIQVNQQSQGLDYLLQKGDQISVYPVFELFNVSGVSQLREEALRNPAFICDVHLGKLCKHLRMFGFDSLYSNQYTSEQLISISLQENRILLSRSSRLTHHKDVTRSYRIRSTDPREQIKDLFCKLDLSGLAHPFTRCLVCNSKLVSVEKEKISDRLQPNTEQYYLEFLSCPTCDKIFWEGSHFEKMLEFIHLNLHHPCE